MASPMNTTDMSSASRVVRVSVVVVLCMGIAIVALGVGRYRVSPVDIVMMLVSKVFPVAPAWAPQAATVVFDVRMPRILLSLLIGGGLAISGGVLQGVFRNPLVSPDVIGVSAGASLGGVLALSLGLGSPVLVISAFAFGMLALLMVLTIGRLARVDSLIMIVLGGVVVGAFFSALVSLTTYLADPYTTLPSIVFWLLGSLATTTYAKLAIAAGPILGGTAVMYALRWRLNVLSLGDDDARALGVKPETTRLVLLSSVALVTAGTVAVAGVIGWIGLLVPHLARMWTGSDHRVLLPVSFFCGAGYLTLIDTMARSMSAGEVPLGVITAVIGAPFFLFLLLRMRSQVWSDA